MSVENKVALFKKHFNIESEIENVKFSLDRRNNLIAKFDGKEFILNAKKNKDKFLTYDPMKYTKRYGVKFLCAIKLESPEQKPRQVKDTHKKK